MKLLGSFITKKPVIITFVFLIVLIVLIFGATKMRLATGNETLMRTDSEVYKNNQKLEQYFGGESIIILNTSEEVNGILTIENINRMKELENSLKQYDEIYSFISPASIIEQLTDKQSGKMLNSMEDVKKGLKEMGGKLSAGTTGIDKMGNKLLEISNGLDTLTSFNDIMHPGVPVAQATLNTLLYEEGKLRSVFNELILDDQHSIMMIKLEGDTSDSVKEEIAKTIKEQLDREPFEGVQTIVTGKPVMDSAVHAGMQESMKKMIMIAVVIMIAVLMLVFPVRWRILSIPIILLSVIATLGLMGYVNVPMTMVSMAVFPILIGLGVDYAIQFQNRYEEELAKEESINA